jgi:hypothetical protein
LLIYQFAGKVTQFSVKNKIHYRNLALKKTRNTPKEKINTPKVFSITPRVLTNTPKVLTNTPKVLTNTPKVMYDYKQINVYLQACGRA